MGWTRRANPKWSDRHGMTANHAKEACYDISYDRQGNTRWNHWAHTWTNGSTRWAKRNTNRQQRAADKLKIIHGIEDHFDALEDHGCEFDWRGNQTNDDWYDDEEMDLPDWWYDRELDDRFYPDCDEPEDDPQDDHQFDYWYDDPWDDYRTPEYDYRHDEASSYMSLAREMTEDHGETLGEILRRHL